MLALGKEPLWQVPPDPQRGQVYTISSDSLILPEKSKDTKMPEDLHTAEKTVIQRCLEKNANNISATAKELGMSRNTLYQRIRKYGL